MMRHTCSHCRHEDVPVNAVLDGPIMPRENTRIRISANNYEYLIPVMREDVEAGIISEDAEMVADHQYAVLVYRFEGRHDYGDRVYEFRGVRFG